MNIVKMNNCMFGIFTVVFSLSTDKTILYYILFIVLEIKIFPILINFNLCFMMLKLWSGLNKDLLLDSIYIY